MAAVTSNMERTDCNNIYVSIWTESICFIWGYYMLERIWGHCQPAASVMADENEKGKEAPKPSRFLMYAVSNIVLRWSSVFIALEMPCPYTALCTVSGLQQISPRKDWSLLRCVISFRWVCYKKYRPGGCHAATVSARAISIGTEPHASILIRTERAESRNCWY